MARFDYTAVGHVTVDVLAGGVRQPGGGAFYSALQASRLGLRALIITRGAREEIEDLLGPHRHELELEVQPAACTTTLQTCGRGVERRQRVLAWAGPIETPASVDTQILHLAPVARETGSHWHGQASFIGLTPQGLVRRWQTVGSRFSQGLLVADQLPARLDAAVISEAERDSCEPLLAHPHAVVAVTAGAGATVVHAAAIGTVTLEVPALQRFVDDLGAGDVFAAAFFCALERGDDPVQAAAYGNAAAAVKIAAEGPASIGDRDALARRLRSAQLPGGGIEQA